MKEYILLLVCTGAGDFFDMKGVTEEFFEKSGMKKKVQLYTGQQQDLPASGQTGKHHL